MNYRYDNDSRAHLRHYIDAANHAGVGGLVVVVAWVILVIVGGFAVTVWGSGR